MTTISFATSASSLLKGSRSVVVIAPTGVLRRGSFPTKLLPKRVTDTALDLARDVTPGDRGAVGSTLAKDPRYIQVGVLPDTLSRYNTPSRADCIRHVVASVGARKGKVAIVLILDEAEHLLPAVNAIGRALPTYTAKSKSSSARVHVLAALRSGEIIAADDVVKTTVACARDSAALVDTPPTELNPEALGKTAKQMLKAIRGVKVTEFAGDALLKHGLRGIHSVGRCAVNAPRMIVATHRRAKARRHIALVGKGVTFDTGGLHLKQRGAMETMKADMGGAAAVLGAFRVLASTGCPHDLTLVLCLAENAIGPSAYKPDDILHMHSGKTVEINNTDAEGRLLLADGVSYAARELNADVIFDAATLTGAQLVSTGLLHAAVVSDDAELEAKVIAAGRRSGDLCHPLPFAPELFMAEFQSPVADMRNSVANRANAQSSCAAQFVYAHLGGAKGAGRRKWCHVDLAGPAFPKDRGTGYGVALLSEAVRSLD